MANFNFNKVIIGGRLTADVELKQTPSGVAVCAFSIAVNRKGAERKTDFIDVVARRQTAEFINRYFKKGSSICVVGNLQKREWTDKNGQKRYITEVIAEEASFVDSKSDSSSAKDVHYDSHYDDNGEFEEIADGDDLPF